MALVATVLSLGLGVSLVAASPAGAKARAAKTPSIKSRLLALSDLPAGWTVDNSASSTSTVNNTACFGGFKSPAKGGSRATASFVEGTIPDLNETLATGNSQVTRWKAINRALAKCKSISFNDNGNNVSGALGALSFPRIGNQSSAYSFTFTVQGISAGVDLVLFRVGNFVGLLEYGNIGTPDVDQLTTFAQEGASKAGSTKQTGTGKTTAPKPAGIGATLSYASGLSVTLDQVIDPATPADSFETAPVGDRIVGIQWTLHNTGSVTVSDDANNDTTVVGSDDQDYSATFEGVASCTNFNSGEYNLATNQSVIGCVSVDMPTGVTVASVEFQLGGFNNATLDWAG